ncbi:PIG-L family deacetylase [Aquihabitans sp. G128]|uniref:PIG-L deacetylase family protein n=1 Tax=Aquihabitans sp. G128 TaxID=2849779 RepID=UPI001C228D99|nr:PIG-L deacetylase family protein [Aquihabitans sp. G128]QXC62212.1 PIG-L family deacetylase [Aquihabitans sp. G128]
MTVRSETRPGDPATSAFPVQAPVDEATWRRWAARIPLADPAAGPVLVVAPHPDDETLGCGGLIADLCRRGVDVAVVTVTDGEGSHPGSPGLAELRHGEQARALAHLGVPSPTRRLGLPDGSVHAHADDLVARLRELAAGASLVVAPWSEDGHTDHDACGLAAISAAAAVGAEVWAYPVWAWQWAQDHELDGLDWVGHEVSSSARQAKQRAVACFASQTTGMLGAVIVGPEALPRFERTVEVFARVG